MLKQIWVATTILFMIGSAFLSLACSGPLTPDEAERAIQKELDKIVKRKQVSQAMVLISSPKHDFHQGFTAGEMNGKTVDINQPFHVASIGKNFTAVLIAKLKEEGKLSLDDSITEYLDSSLLNGLYVFENMDYQEKVTIRMLLNHTSGVGNYSEHPLSGSDSLIELIIKEQNQLWTPDDLISFTRDYQEPVGIPGEVYHYSDTGYILLGKIIEKVSGQSFAEELEDKIFIPLDLQDTYLMFYDHLEINRPEIADVWLGGTNIKDYNSLSMEWAGGGLISTVHDLEKFVVGVYDGTLLKKETIEEFSQFDYQFERGIEYGLGFMNLKRNDFFFIRKSLPDMKGHIGAFGTNLFYDPKSETLYIASFGSTEYTAGSIESMITFLSITERIE